MKIRVIHRQLAASSFIALLTLNLINCGKANTSAKSLAANSEAGAGGEAGSPAAETLVCGKLAPTSNCDPISAAPCNVAAGETCEYDFGPGSFLCLSVGEFSQAGGPCGKPGSSCGPSTTCNQTVNQGTCQHYCCSDDECEQGTCYLDLFDDGEASVGVCIDEFTDSK